MFKNLTPHSITLRLPSGEDKVIPASGEIARVNTLPAEAETLTGIPVPVLPSPSFGGVTGLPGVKSGVMYIVSGYVLAQCIGRDDVFAPATGPKDGAIRNQKGHIQAVTQLRRAPRL